MINAKNLIHSYEYAGSSKRSLNDVSIDISKGEFVAVLGHNGCGKSTLVKHFNALLELQEGELSVCEINARDEASIWRLRRKVGMVFQNPDNQFVSSIVKEDVAFGLENYQVPRSEIPGLVHNALKKVGMEDYETRSPHTLSGGQKQRIALSGILAIDPDVLVFDESTAMLDPEGRKEILSAIKSLHKEGKTIVMITHYIEEAVFADKVFLMHNGKMLASGTPQKILTNIDLLKETDLTPPTCVNLYYDLKAKGIVLPFCPLTNEELVEELCQL